MQFINVTNALKLTWHKHTIMRQCESTSGIFTDRNTYIKIINFYEYSNLNFLRMVILVKHNTVSYSLTLPKCRLLCEVDYEFMSSFPIFRCSL